jgi:hypothetical protein
LRWDGDAMPRNKMAIEEKRGEEMAVEDTPERERRQPKLMSHEQ